MYFLSSGVKGLNHVVDGEKEKKEVEDVQGCSDPKVWNHIPCLRQRTLKMISCWARTFQCRKFYVGLCYLSWYPKNINNKKVNCTSIWFCKWFTWWNTLCNHQQVSSLRCAYVCWFCAFPIFVAGCHASLGGKFSPAVVGWQRTPEKQKTCRLYRKKWKDQAGC